MPEQQYARVLLHPAGTNAPPGDSQARVQITATPLYGVFQATSGRLYSNLTGVVLCAPESRVQIAGGAVAEAPAGTPAWLQITAAPLYGVQGHFPGRLGWNQYGVLSTGGSVVLGQCDIVGSTALEIVAVADYAATADLAGSTQLEIIGTRALVGAVTIAGDCVLIIEGTRVLGGVVQMDGFTTLTIIVTANGVYITCYTGNGQPVAPMPSFGKNYVF